MDFFNCRTGIIGEPVMVGQVSTMSFGTVSPKLLCARIHGLMARTGLLDVSGRNLPEDHIMTALCVLMENGILRENM